MSRQLLLGMFLLVAGCGAPDIRLDRNAAPAEIVGVWTMTDTRCDALNRSAAASGMHGVAGD